MQKTRLQNKIRIVGWDWIRIFAIVPMVMFHNWQFIFYADEIHFSHAESFYYLLVDVLGYFGTYCGLMICAQSFLMFGFFRSRFFNSYRWGLLFLGIFILQIAKSENPTDLKTWSWDVYSFLALAILFCRLLSSSKSLRRLMALPSVLILLIADSQWQVWAQSLFADSKIYLFAIGHGPGEFDGWNMIPWIAIPALFYILGCELGPFWEKHKDKFNFKAKEFILWVVIFIGLFLNYKSYYPVPAGAGFDRFVFQMKPLLFWEHFMVFIFFLRLALDPRINIWLTSARWIGAITTHLSNLAWIRYFGWTYLAHVLIYSVIGENVYNWKQHPRQFDLLWLGVMVAAELMVRFGFLITNRIKLNKMRFSLNDRGSQGIC